MRTEPTRSSHVASPNYVRLSDGASALAFAETMPAEAVASMLRERRANYQLDLAEAHRQLGHHDQAAAALVAADKAAPEEVRCRPLGRGLVGEMLPLSQLGGAAPVRASGRIARMSERVLYAIVCGAGPAPYVDRLVKQ